jgi:hypothetical protein
MTLVGLDLNSTRARAVHGSEAGAAVPLALEEDHVELPLAISLEGRKPVPGRLATAACRKVPHFTCLDFLPHLGGERAWTAGRHRIDAAGALSIVCESVASRFSKSHGVALTLPTYLDGRQRALLNQILTKARWRVSATVAAPVAAALAAFEYLPWAGLALIGDVDGHAFTWSAVSVRGDRATLLETTSLPGAGRTAWLRRLIDAVAIRCVRTTRRDPRESADAEQSLYDQLAERLDSRAEASRAELIIQTKQWFQNLLLDADELRSWCAPLAAQLGASMMDARDLASAHGPVTAVLLTASAGRLPGLVAQLEDQLRPPAVLRQNEVAGDFGDGLLLEDTNSIRVHVLEPDALARAAHEIVARVQRGDLAGGH